MVKESCLIEGTKGKISLPLFHMADKATLKTDQSKQVFHGTTDYLVQADRAAAEIRAGKMQSDYIPFTMTKQCMSIMDECRRQMGLRYPFEEK